MSDSGTQAKNPSRRPSPFGNRPRLWYGCTSPPSRVTLRPYIRVLFIMVMSYIVVLLGSAAVADATVPLAERDRFWLVLFALMALATVLAARLFRRNDRP